MTRRLVDVLIVGALELSGPGPRGTGALRATLADGSTYDLVGAEVSTVAHGTGHQDAAAAFPTVYVPGTRRLDRQDYTWWVAVDADGQTVLVPGEDPAAGGSTPEEVERLYGPTRPHPVAVTR